MYVFYVSFFTFLDAAPALHFGTDMEPVCCNFFLIVSLLPHRHSDSSCLVPGVATVGRLDFIVIDNLHPVFNGDHLAGSSNSSDLGQGNNFAAFRQCWVLVNNLCRGQWLFEERHKNSRYWRFVSIGGSQYLFGGKQALTFAFVFPG